MTTKDPVGARIVAHLVTNVLTVAADALEDLVVAHGYQVTGSVERAEDGSIVVTLRAAQ